MSFVTKKGYLTIVFGPMFSGKTSYLIESIKNIYLINGLKKVKTFAVVLNHGTDNRSLNKIGSLTTHNNSFKFSSLPSEVKFLSTTDLRDVYDDLKESDYIFIDECQFFKNLEETVKKLLKDGKNIMLSGLVTDSDLNPFGEMHNLFPFADEVLQKKAYCVYCKTGEKNASFTKFIGEIPKCEKILVGSEKSFVPVCRFHHS